MNPLIKNEEPQWIELGGGQRRKICQHVQRGHGARRALDAGGLVGQMLAHL